jgi:hypothetical protein
VWRSQSSNKGIKIKNAIKSIFKPPRKAAETWFFFFFFFYFNPKKDGRHLGTTKSVKGSDK